MGNNIYIDQFRNDIKEYEQWGKLLEGQSWTHFFNSNSAMSYSIIHNGLKYAKKWYAILDIKGLLNC